MTATFKLATWKHPSSGELRVYVNDPCLDRGVKLFFFRGENEVDPDFADYRINGASGLAAKRATDLANEIGQACRASWNQLLAMVEG